MWQPKEPLAEDHAEGAGKSEAAPQQHWQQQPPPPPPPPPERSPHQFVEDALEMSEHHMRSARGGAARRGAERGPPAIAVRSSVACWRSLCDARGAVSFRRAEGWLRSCNHARDFLAHTPSSLKPPLITAVSYAMPPIVERYLRGGHV